MAPGQRMRDLMTTETHLERKAIPQREDARDLIARLCRELGVAAVAAALKEPDYKALARDIEATSKRLAA